MTRKEWAAIKAAADLLDLGEKASLAEIKKAYRRLSRKHHPDMQRSPEPGTEKIPMHEITDAYQTLIEYCTGYRFPFVPGPDEELEGDDWWFERFGQDHLWGKGNVPEEDPEI
jgi:hypothetical protein